jgi:hypothetical protein
MEAKEKRTTDNTDLADRNEKDPTPVNPFYPRNPWLIVL